MCLKNLSIHSYSSPLWLFPRKIFYLGKKWTLDLGFPIGNCLPVIWIRLTGLRSKCQDVGHMITINRRSPDDGKVFTKYFPLRPRSFNYPFAKYETISWPNCICLGIVFIRLGLASFHWLLLSIPFLLSSFFVLACTVLLTSRLHSVEPVIEKPTSFFPPFLFWFAIMSTRQSFWSSSGGYLNTLLENHVLVSISASNLLPSCTCTLTHTHIYISTESIGRLSLSLSTSRIKPHQKQIRGDPRIVYNQDNELARIIPNNV